MNGIDWAYRQMVTLAYEIGAHAVRQFASQLRADVCEACAGAAAADADHAEQRGRSGFPYRTILRVMDDLRDQRKEMEWKRS